MFTGRQLVETTALQCRKGLSILPAKAMKGLEHQHLFLLSQSLVFSVTDWTRLHSNVADNLN